MKTKVLFSILLIAFGSPSLAAADAKSSSPAPHEMAAVEQFLELSDADLDQLQQVITRIRAMSVEERSELLKEIQKYRALPETEREQLRMGWGWMPKELQDAWREMMRSATPERREAIQKELQSLEPADRAAKRRQMVEEYLKSKKQGHQD